MRFTTLIAVAGAAGLSAGASAAGEEAAFSASSAAGAPLASVAPLVAHVASAASGDEEQVIVLEGDDGERVRIVIGPDGEATIDVVEDEEIEVIREGDTVRIIEKKDGRVLLEGELGGALRFRAGEGGARFMMRGGEGARLMLRGPEGRAPAGGERPVRIGVNMAAVSDAVRAQLGLDEGGVLVTGVVDGLPAQKAGLKRYDVIVQVDGASPATPERLRRAVLRSEPGETVTLTVMRGGEKREIEVTVEAVGDAGRDVPRQWRQRAEEERERMRRGRGGGGEGQRGGVFFERGGEAVRLRELMEQEALERALREAERAGAIVMRELESVDWKGIERQIEEAMKSVELDEQTRRQLEGAMRQLEQQLTGLDERLQETIRREIGEREEVERKIRRALERVRTNAPEIRFFGLEEENGEAIVLRERAEEEEGSEKDETEDLSSRLTRMEERMSRLEALLERLVEQQRN
jgi:hypothetical protein